MHVVQNAAERRAVIGRLAGLLFAVGAVASVPTNEMFRNPRVGEQAHWIDLLAFVSGVICLAIPWRRVPERWFHLVPIAGAAEVALSVWGIGSHGAVYSWYYVLVVVYAAYAFERRVHIAGHSAFVALAVAAPIAYRPDDTNTVIVSMVAIPVILAVAAVVTYLREGLEEGRALLAEQASTDPLTGLMNLRVRDELLDYELVRHDRAGRELAVLVLDLDRFKEVNDTDGHPAGDRLLREVAAVLRASVRSGDTVSRPGGDEFCVIAPETGPADAQRLAERIEMSLASLVAVGRPLSASIGIAQFPRDGRTAEELIDRADHDQRLVKQAGGALREARLHAA